MRLSLVLTSLLVAGCGEGVLLQADASPDDATEAELLTNNGIPRNGLGPSTLSNNGLELSGLALASLPNAVKTTAFRQWFNSSAYTSQATVMKYLVGCAYPSNTSLKWTNPANGKKFSWPGELDLARGWSSTSPSQEDLELVSSCLMARMNSSGTSVLISLRTAKGVISSYETINYTTQEGFFFGNLFHSTGFKFACHDDAFLTLAHINSLYSGRQCTLGRDQCYLDVQGPCSAICGYAGGVWSCKAQGRTFLNWVQVHLP